jgi:hypothetical protein
MGRICGTSHISHEFNRGLGKADLRRLVGTFIETCAGKEDAQRTMIPLATLPHFELGDALFSPNSKYRR